uniref:Uncharacterized protein n=1 Tax=Acrobeloides nanus TaxID=290746 RepID=A0A914C961_9BILA
MKPYRNFVLKVIKKSIRMTETANNTDAANKVVPNLNKRRQTLESKNIVEEPGTFFAVDLQLVKVVQRDIFWVARAVIYVHQRLPSLCSMHFVPSR